jgi:hypothetical protein
MKFYKSLLATALLGSQLLAIQFLVMNCPNAWATRRVCSNGTVSHSSCPEDFSTSLYGSRSAGASAQTAVGGTPSSAKIVEPVLIKHRGGMGLWKGHIRGQGKVRLILAISRDGTVVEHREMGSVEVSLSEKPTRFNFQSSLPSGDAWTWQILPMRAH